MAENGLMTGAEIDGVIYFTPDQGISRAEFLALAMKAAGIKDPGKLTETVFADDSGETAVRKGEVDAAQHGVFTVAGKKLTRFDHACTPFLRKRRYRNNGAPSTAITMPTGNS